MLKEKQFKQGGFEWVDLNNRNESVVVYKRIGNKPKDDVLVVLNLTPVVRTNWKVHVYGKSKWTEIFNSDSKVFWGVGDIYNPQIEAERVNKKDKWYVLNLHLPALSAVVLK